jgi:hypothetical protein
MSEIYLQAQLTARSKLLVRARESLINIRDELEDERSDRVFFGSTNDADRFRALVDELDGWVWDDIIGDAEQRDYIGELRTLHSAYDIVRACEEEACQQRSNLVALLRRLAYRHSKQLPLDEALAGAMDYLTREGLHPSILRAEEDDGSAQTQSTESTGG